MGTSSRKEKPQEPRRFYTITEVTQMTTLSRSTIYRKMEAGSFPHSIAISDHRIGWAAQDIEAWCEFRMEDSRRRLGR